MNQVPPEAQDSSDLYLRLQLLHFSVPSCSLALLAPHSSTVTPPAKWPWLWNLAGQASPLNGTHVTVQASFHSDTICYEPQEQGLVFSMSL